METQPLTPKPKSRKLLWFLLFLILLIIIGVGVWFFWQSIETNNTGEKEDGFAGELKKKPAKIDKNASVTKTFSTAAGTMSVRGADGTLYTLTVPDGALILPSEIIMSTLTESSVENWGKPYAGYGVFLDGKFSFIRPAYLTIQPNTEMPQVGKYKAVDWGRCNIASRGYDPEICAGNSKIPLRGGVEPGKVVVFVSSEFDQILLTPTIPTGKTNVYNGFVFRSGAYFADNINKTKAAQLADKMYAGSNDYTNQTETLMHLWALGGDLAKYKTDIEKFERTKDDYPREVLKGAIIAKAVSANKVYDARIADFKKEYQQALDNTRAAFLPLPRYFALLEQLSIERKKSAGSWFSVNAREEPLGKWPDSLPWYDEDAREDTGGSDWAEDMRQRSNQILRDILTSKNKFCSEKFEAAESLEALGTLDAADRAAISSILGQCNKKCATLEECEHDADNAKRYGNNDAYMEAIYRMNAFLEQGTDCKALVKKNLENYGQNFCQ
jgi:hypothetical protein